MTEQERQELWLEAIRTFFAMGQLVLDGASHKAILGMLKMAYKCYGKEIFWKEVTQDIINYALEDDTDDTKTN